MIIPLTSRSTKIGICANCAPLIEEDANNLEGGDQLPQLPERKKIFIYIYIYIKVKLWYNYILFSEDYLQDSKVQIWKILHN